MSDYDKFDNQKEKTQILDLLLEILKILKDHGTKMSSLELCNIYNRTSADIYEIKEDVIEEACDALCFDNIINRISDGENSDYYVNPDIDIDKLKCSTLIHKIVDELLSIFDEDSDNDYDDEEDYNQIAKMNYIKNLDIEKHIKNYKEYDNTTSRITKTCNGELIIIDNIIKEWKEINDDLDVIINKYSIPSEMGQEFALNSANIEKLNNKIATMKKHQNNLLPDHKAHVYINETIDKYNIEKDYYEKVNKNILFYSSRREKCKNFKKCINEKIRTYMAIKKEIIELSNKI
jgi:hypothetical protein